MAKLHPELANLKAAGTVSADIFAEIVTWLGPILTSLGGAVNWTMFIETVVSTVATAGVGKGIVFHALAVAGPLVLPGGGAGEAIFVLICNTAATELGYVTPIPAPTPTPTPTPTVTPTPIPATTP